MNIKIRSLSFYSRLIWVVGMLGIVVLVTGCGQSRHEKALQTAKTLMGNGSLSDTEAIKYKEASAELLERLATVKIEASQRQIYVLERLLQRYKNQEMWPKAADVVDQLISLQPTEIRWRLNKGQVHSQWSQVNPDHVEPARNAFRAALELNSESLEAKYGLGILYAFRTDDRERGRRYLRQVADHSPIDVKNRNIIKEARFALGRLDYERSNYSSAANRFRQITEMESISKTSRFMAHRNLGRTYLKMGNRGRAKDSLNKAYKLQPTNSDVRRMLRDLGVELSDRYNRFD